MPVVDDLLGAAQPGRMKNVPSERIARTKSPPLHVATASPTTVNGLGSAPPRATAIRTVSVTETVIVVVGTGMRIGTVIKIVIGTEREEIEETEETETEIVIEIGTATATVIDATTRIVIATGRIEDKQLVLLTVQRKTAHLQLDLILQGTEIPRMEMRTSAKGEDQLMMT